MLSQSGRNYNEKLNASLLWSKLWGVLDLSVRFENNLRFRCVVIFCNRNVSVSYYNLLFDKNIAGLVIFNIDKSISRFASSFRNVTIICLNFNEMILFKTPLSCFPIERTIFPNSVVNSLKYPFIKLFSAFWQRKVILFLLQ